MIGLQPEDAGLPPGVRPRGRLQHMVEEGERRVARHRHRQCRVAGEVAPAHGGLHGQLGRGAAGVGGDIGERCRQAVGIGRLGRVGSRGRAHDAPEHGHRHDEVLQVEPRDEVPVVVVQLGLGDCAVASGHPGGRGPVERGQGSRGRVHPADAAVGQVVVPRGPGVRRRGGAQAEDGEVPARLGDVDQGRLAPGGRLDRDRGAREPRGGAGKIAERVVRRRHADVRADLIVRRRRTLDRGHVVPPRTYSAVSEKASWAPRSAPRHAPDMTVAAGDSAWRNAR